MKKVIQVFVAAAIILQAANLCPASAPATSQKETKLRLCTFNIRGDKPSDGPNQWVHRKDWLCEIIRNNDFDIVGFQEAVLKQFEDILERVPHGFVGIRGLYNPIIYKTERFELLQTDTFWLSETMAPGSVGWDGKYDRYCTWARFKERKSGNVFLVFNTHFDHRGVNARTKAAELMIAQIKRIAKEGEPVFFCGDLNRRDTTEAYKLLAAVFNDTYITAPVKTGPMNTAHSWGRIEPIHRIDYIFVNNEVNVTDYHVIDDKRGDNLYPSDHYPVYINAIIGKKKP
ncbi:endonuclease/exonuclease/phosphatase family protein [Ereboglobus luteus]|uniref:Endonuclease/exonuclease/phosphatase domain-containing protein n=1 Tax=Ereboglobus luteus TaxID=1796921 RepID=A0A2U8E305_9BACT|nr:endonuclease/exonuclease/phosphatase family protein [Ereboglobus luteus]AWI09253.1 hypothetical protein CKA38_08370 [Ereboglobus luteus]